MENILLQYMSDRFHLQTDNIGKPARGPIITISRQTGCPGKAIAEELLLQLRRSNFWQKPDAWRIVSKEILAKAASSLGVEENKLGYLFQAEGRGLIDEMVQAFAGKHYISDRKARRTIKEVILSIAAEGSVIILGRAGVAITSEVPGAFHFRLIAPLEWRAAGMAERRGISLADAIIQIKYEDQQREKMLKAFGMKNTNEDAFHVTFNCALLSVQEIVCAMLQIIEGHFVSPAK